MEGAPADRLRRFFQEQRAVADALWSLLDAPDLLPPLSARAVLAHAARLPRYAPVLRAMGRPLRAVLARHGLEGFEPLRQYLDATLQITVQTSSARAEAPFALSALDYYFRGTGHVHGGIGALATAMVRAIERCGGAVRKSDRVPRLERLARGRRVHPRRRAIHPARVVANVPPSRAARRLPRPRLGRRGSCGRGGGGRGRGGGVVGGGGGGRRGGGGWGGGGGGGGAGTWPGGTRRGAWRGADFSGGLRAPMRDGHGASAACTRPL